MTPVGGGDVKRAAVQLHAVVIAVPSMLTHNQPALRAVRIPLPFNPERGNFAARSNTYMRRVSLPSAIIRILRYNPPIYNRFYHFVLSSVNKLYRNFFEG